MPKYTPVDDALHEYLLAHRTPDDPILDELRAETARAMGDLKRMQIAAEQGTFLGILVGALGARRVVEVGTFTGMSALCMARALPKGGVLYACDVSSEFTAVGKPFWEKAGVADKIDLRIGPAAETLRSLPKDPPLDFAFIDADKTGYRTYYEEILARLRPGGLIAIDNVFWGGQVLRPQDQSPDTVALRELNDFIARDRRVQSVMIGLADGLTLARKLGE